MLIDDAGQGLHGPACGFLGLPSDLARGPSRPAGTRALEVAKNSMSQPADARMLLASASDCWMIRPPASHT
jgi:hypothetical protein